MNPVSSGLHADTLIAIRVALRSDPARLDTETIRRAVAAVAAVAQLPWAHAGMAELPIALTQAGVARMLGCSRWTVVRMVKAGILIPHGLLPDGRCPRYLRQQVEGLLIGSATGRAARSVA